MSQTLSYAHDYAASAEHVFQQGVREDYISEEAVHLDHFEARILKLQNDDASGGSAEFRYRVDTSLPNWAKKILPAKNTITESHVWPGPQADGTRSYSFDVAIANVPAKAKGVATIRPTGPDSCRVTTEIEITANMPLVGKKLEDLVARDLGTTVEGKMAFMEQWLNKQS